MYANAPMPAAACIFYKGNCYYILAVCLPYPDERSINLCEPESYYQVILPITINTLICSNMFSSPAY